MSRLDSIKVHCSFYTGSYGSNHVQDSQSLFLGVPLLGKATASETKQSKHELKNSIAESLHLGLCL